MYGDFVRDQGTGATVPQNITKKGSLKWDWISPPGHTIADMLEERNWTQIQLADRLGVSRNYVSELVTGKATISEADAIKLARVLGSTVGFWLKREACYRAALADLHAI